MQSILRELVKSPAMRRQYIRVVVHETWIEQMGPLVVKYTKKLSIRKNTLSVYVTSDPLRHELRYHKSKIIDMMNEKLGENLIQEVIIK